MSTPLDDEKATRKYLDDMASAEAQDYLDLTDTEQTITNPAGLANLIADVYAGRVVPCKVCGRIYHEACATCNASGAAA